MKVEQLMSKDVKTCTPNNTIDIAARIMWESDCGVVPVVDHDGRVVGMITDRDICMAGFTQGIQYWEIPVSSAASKVLVAVRPTDSVQTAEELMRKHRIRRLAVTDDGGRLVGVLSLNDLALHAGRRGDEITLDEVARTLSAICQHGPAGPATRPQRAA